jgi:hypothetical protein
MKKFTVTTLLTLAGLVSAGSALAQIRHEVTANVPFQFSVGNKVLPAGNYRFDEASSPVSANEILIQNIDQPRYTVLARGSDAWEALPNNVTDRGSLVFDEYDGEHFLREVRGPLNAINVELPKSKTEKGAEGNQVAAPSTSGQTTVALGQ